MGIIVISVIKPFQRATAATARKTEIARSPPRRPCCCASDRRRSRQPLPLPLQASPCSSRPLLSAASSLSRPGTLPRAAASPPPLLSPQMVTCFSLYFPNCDCLVNRVPFSVHGWFKCSSTEFFLRKKVEETVLNELLMWH
jgi:hypothetical protein